MEFSLIVPTFNESENLPVLVQELSKRLEGDFEVLVVDDDSPDETWRVGEQLSSQYGFVRVVRRIGEKGLSSAVIEGFSQARGDIVGVMDADLSHPPSVIPKLVSAVGGGMDVAVASRYVPGGGVEDWPALRLFISRVAGLMARGLTGVRDPMSGCFMVKKSVVEDRLLNPLGFKILLEILVKGDYDSNRVVEVPILFRNRLRGESKLGGQVMLQYISHLIKLYLYRYGLR